VITGHEITLSAWIIGKEFSGDDEIIGTANREYTLRVRNSHPYFNFRNLSYDLVELQCSSTALDTNQWYYITATYNGTNMYVYVNGDENCSKAGSFGDFNTTQITYTLIGAYSSLYNYFNGTIDEVMIFNRSLSADEIKALYNASAYKYHHNFTNLTNGTHTFTGYAVDRAGNINDTTWQDGTGGRSVTVDTGAPIIAWESPTPADGDIINYDDVYLNVTVMDSSNTSAFFDWNKSLVGYWSMDYYNSTGVYDNSTYNNFGAFNGGLGTDNITNGKYGKGLEFDGSNDYVDCGNDSHLNFGIGDFSIEVWKKGYTEKGRLVAKRPLNPVVGYELLDRNNVISVLIGDGTTYYHQDVGTTNIDDDLWHHIVMVWNASSENVTVYLDGNFDGQANYAGIGNIDTTAHLYIGRWTSGQYYGGTIDEVRIYNRTLSPEEINASYNNGLYRLYHNFTDVADGAYNYSAYAIDDAGNLKVETERKVTVDTTPPTYFADSDNSSGSVVTGQSVKISVKWSDSTGLDYITLRTNKSGSWSNESYLDVSGTQAWGNFTFSTTGYGGKTICWVEWANDTVNNLNSSMSTSAHCFHVNTAPDTTQIVLNSTLGTNYTTEDLLCWAEPYDTDAGDTLTAFYEWWKNDTLNMTGSKTSLVNGTLQLISNLTSGNTSKHENWTCSVKMYDGIVNESEWNNASLYIRNSAPDKVSLYAPADGSNTTDRTPTFMWNGTDPDNDTLNYTIYIVCGHIAGGGCSDDNRIENTTTNSYTPTEELQYLGDDNYYYNWSVKAWDGETYGEESDVWNITINSAVILSLPTSFVNFGSKNVGDTDNTTDDDPNPFVIQNDGNCKVHVNISASDLLWDTKPSASEFFRYKADNVSGEEGAFNSSGSQTTWADVPTSDTKFLDSLNYSDVLDSAEIDILITVPLDEGAGNKSSTLVFTGEYIGE